MGWVKTELRLLCTTAVVNLKRLAVLCRGLPLTV